MLEATQQILWILGKIIVGNYELVLPSLSELQAICVVDVVSTGSGQVITEGQFPNNGAVPSGWPDIDAVTFWTATSAGSDQHVLYGLGSNLYL